MNRNTITILAVSDAQRAKRLQIDPAIAQKPIDAFNLNFESRGPMGPGSEAPGLRLRGWDFQVPRHVG